MVRWRPTSLRPASRSCCLELAANTCARITRFRSCRPAPARTLTCWDFFVRHYADRDKRERDPKYVKKEDDILYPRGATLGGSTAISAMITLYPSNSGWEYLASLTGDDDWNPDAMRRRFERIESWRGPDPDPAHPARPGDGSRHGFKAGLPHRRSPYSFRAPDTHDSAR